MPERAGSAPFFHIVAAGLGLVCLIAAQALLLESRHPVAPLILYILGFALWLPALNGGTLIDEAPPTAAPVEENRSEGWQERRWFYAASVLFFTTISLLAAQTGVVSPLLIFSWLLSVVLAASGLLAGERFLPRWSWSLAPLEIAGVVALVVITAILHSQTPALSTPLPDGHLAGPLYQYIERLFLSLADLDNVNPLSSILTPLLVPAVYLLSRLISGAGFFAAGFSAVSGWTLALAKVGHIHSVLALMSALFLAALIYAERSRQRAPYLWVGILIGVGSLFSSLFIYLALLVPVAGVLVWLDERRDRKRIVRHHSAALLMFLVMWLPSQGIINAPPSAAFQTWLDPVVTFLDGLSRSLLMFNLTGDSSPFHGLVNRPVFSPILAASFVAGVLVWIWRVHQNRRWSDTLPLIALVVALLPSALSYSPDLQRAALALPISSVIAASSIAFLAQRLTQRWGRVGLGIATALYVVALAVIAADARDHYTNTFLPAYEQAAQIYRQMPPARP